MVQTVLSVTIHAWCKKLVLEKPLVLRRIFMSIRALADNTVWHESRISFDDPNFDTYFVIDGPGKYFEIKGKGISQGDVWVFNVAGTDLLYTATEILV